MHTETATLASVRCRGLRAFERETAIELSPLTLLFGANNSGKSTLLKLPSLAMGCLADPRFYTLNAAGTIFGSDFRDLATATQPHPSLSYGFGWFDPKGEHHYDAELQYFTSPRADKAHVIPTSISVDHRTVQSTEDLPPHDWWTRDEGLTTGVDRARRVAEDLLGKTVYVPSVRPGVNSVYETHDQPTEEPRGEATAHALRHNSRLLAEVSDWMTEHLGLTGLQIESSGFAFRLVTGAVNLSDAGRGVQSALPLVTLLIGLKSGLFDSRVILIEEPEAHLHPSAQAPMADLLISARRAGRVIVVETHSEAILLRLRRRVAESVISVDDLKLHYVARDGQVAHAATIPVDHDGTTKFWPEGVFDYDVIDAEAIVASKLARLQG